MKIRVKYRGGAWWAHFNGQTRSPLGAKELPHLCELLKNMESMGWFCVENTHGTFMQNIDLKEMGFWEKA